MKYRDNAESVNGIDVGTSVGTRLADALAPTDDGLEYVRGTEHVGTILGDALRTVTIHYDANEQDADMPETATVNFGARTIIAGAPTADDFLFVEWNDSPDGSGTSFAPAVEIYPVEDMTLYAIWEEED
jgi:hypothetical protein